MMTSKCWFTFSLALAPIIRRQFANPLCRPVLARFNAQRQQQEWGPFVRLGHHVVEPEKSGQSKQALLIDCNYLARSCLDAADSSKCSIDDASGTLDQWLPF